MYICPSSCTCMLLTVQILRVLLKLMECVCFESVCGRRCCRINVSAQAASLGSIALFTCWTSLFQGLLFMVFMSWPIILRLTMWLETHGYQLMYYVMRHPLPPSLQVYLVWPGQWLLLSLLSLLTLSYAINKLFLQTSGDSSDQICCRYLAVIVAITITLFHYFDCFS